MKVEADIAPQKIDRSENTSLWTWSITCVSEVIFH